MAKYSATQKEYIKSVDGYAHQSAVEIIGRIEQQRDELAEALDKLLERYVGLVECGDCGNWDAEKEDEVIKARAALAKARGDAL